jgi:cytochrome c-type biogenesis protein CcmH/NrfF
MQAQNNLAIGENLPPPVALFQMGKRLLGFTGDLCRRTPRNNRSTEGWAEVIPRSGESYGEPSSFPSSAPAGPRELRRLRHATELHIRAYSLWSLPRERRTRLNGPHAVLSAAQDELVFEAACLALAFGQLRRMRGISLLSLLALVFAAAPLFAQAPVQSADRGKTLGNQLMCTCGCGDTAGSCSHPGAAFSGPCDVAKGKLKEMNERIARGESDKTILQAFVQEYGDSALAAPPARGFNWFAYAFPAIAFTIGLVLVTMIIRHWRHRPPQVATASGPVVTPEMLENARSQIKREVQDD